MYFISNSLACSNRTFGKGCMNICSGNCLNNESCGNSDRKCRNCAPGWEGHLCNTSKSMVDMILNLKRHIKLVNYDLFFQNVDFNYCVSTFVFMSNLFILALYEFQTTFAKIVPLSNIFFQNKAFDIGRYGLNCQHVCGHCFKAEQCFHTNGSCSSGCMEGYIGETCSESLGLVFL